MNICVLGLRGLPHVMGGVETHCEQLFPLLKQARPNDSFVVIGRRRYLPDRQIQYMGLKIVALGHAADRRLETVTNAFCGVFYARFVVHADLLHIQGIGAAITIPLAKLFGMKVIVTYHSKNYDHAKWSRSARAFLRLGELSAIYLGDHVISVSNSLENELARRFPRLAYKVHFIPNGANHFYSAPDDATAQGALKQYGLRRKGYIISVGRLVPEKGFHDLIDAFDAADLPDCKLIFVGDADHDDEYSRCLRARATGRIVFTGFLPRDRIHVLLRNASLFVLPSYNEGMPIAALEAVMAGCPVLLSNIQHNRELGLAPQNYFSVGSVRSLCDKLKSDHASYGVDRSALLEAYNWGAACAQTNKLYSSIEDDLRTGQGRLGRKLAALASSTWRLKTKARATGSAPIGQVRREETTPH